MLDILLRNARIVDGTGNPWFHGSVGVSGDRIAAVGAVSSLPARRTIDLNEAVLAPGFIDLHTHSDFTLSRFPRAEAMLRQGVTTQLVGNCGLSPFPVVDERLDLLRSYTAAIDAGLSWNWQDAAGYAAHLQALPLAVNVGLQIGHGAVRIAIMGFDKRAPSATELVAMERLVAQAFEQGVLGLSSGLIYVPGIYAGLDELVALAKVAKQYGGFYSSHIRGEGDTLLDAVDEALKVGRRAGVPVQLSHHKAMGPRNWGRVETTLSMIDQARAEGHDVLADQYPYIAGSTTLTAILPPWAMEGGIPRMLDRLRQPEARSRIYEAIQGGDGSETEVNTGRDFDLETIMISYVPNGPNKWCEGMMLTDIAAKRGEQAAESALYLLESERGAVQMIAFSMSEEDVRRVMRHPAVAVGSDGRALNPAAGGKPHPRSYGTYARVLGHYVREEKVLRLEDAVRKMTSLPAQRLRCYERGLIRPGCVADIVVFDPDRIADRATFHDPHAYCEGVTHVFVNGQLVIENEDDTGASPGRVLVARN